MVTMIATVTDCRSFWRDIVVPYYNDFHAAIDNMSAGQGVLCLEWI
jgi:hypothetical protein